MKKLLIVVISCLFLPVLVSAQDTLTKKEWKKQYKSFLIPGRPWTIEVPLWIPGFAGSFAYGDIEIEGEDGVDPEKPIEPPPGGDFGKILSRLFTKDWYLKFFFLTRVAYENKGFLFQLDGITGSVGGSVKFNYNNKEIVQAKFSTTIIRLIGGYKIVEVTSKNQKFRYELLGYAGVRAHFNNIYSDLNNGNIKLDISPSWAEPILGIQNQFTFRRWFIVFSGDYGGFFIVNKYSTLISGFVYYRSGRVTSLKFGWTHLALNHKSTLRGEQLKLSATFSGPSVGLVFHF